MRIIQDGKARTVFVPAFPNAAPIDMSAFLMPAAPPEPKVGDVCGVYSRDDELIGVVRIDDVTDDGAFTFQALPEHEWPAHFREEWRDDG